MAQRAVAVFLNLDGVLKRQFAATVSHIRPKSE